MNSKSRAGRVLGTALGAVLLAGMVASPAFAGLGGDASSVANDAAKLKGQARSTPAGGYTTNAITLPSGTLVNEYVSAEGKVFAVTWKGESIPNLNQMLGSYFEQYKAAIAAAPSHAGHNHLSVRQDDLVVSSGGHMRAWSGKAYVPSLLPPNFSLSDIK